jgi:hypothetical protein
MALENLDIATEDFLYNQSPIRDVLMPQEAERMVARVLDWLSVLAGDTTHASAYRWIGERCASYVLRFKDFIGLRMESVLMKEQSYVRWVRQGKAFDAETMVIWEGSAPLGTGNGIVKLCLFPAFWQCDAPSITLSPIEFSQPRVLRKSFVLPSSVERANSQCIGRALVVLE